MAQLVLGAVGAVVGFYVGGPTGAQIGFALGSAVGASMTTQKVQGPRLADLKAPQSAYGSVLPYVEGMVRTAGIWAWNGPKNETATTTEQGGKGGPSVESTTYTYDMDVFILLSENELGGLRRVWSNGKLIYSLAENATDNTIDASGQTDAWRRITFYGGGPTQLPDPTYEAAVGTGNAPAYRGRGGVFIEGLNLGGSGQIPMLTFEVFSDGTAGGGEAYTEDFDNETSLAAFGYQAKSGDFGRTTISDISIGGRGISCLGIRKTTSPDTIIKEIGQTYTVAAIDFDFYVGSANNDDAGSIGLISGGFATPVSQFNFNPRREDTFDSLQRAVLNMGDGPFAVGTAAIPIGTWYHLKVRYASGTNASTWEITNKGTGAVLYSGTRTVSTRTVDGINFSVDQNSGITTASDSTFANIRFGAVQRAAPDAVPLADIVARQCQRGTLEASEYDVSALTGNVRGFAVSQVGPPRSTIEMLGLAFQFDAFESGGKVVFRPRAQASVATVQYADLGASSSGRVEPLPLARTNDIELPSQIIVKYANALNDYQDGAEASDRLTTELTSVETTELALVLTPTEARRIAEIRANDIQNSVLSVQGLTLDRSYARLEPCDAITVVDEDGTQFRLRILRISDSALVRKLDAALDDQSAMTGSSNTDENYVDSDTVTMKTGTLLELLDIPLLRDIDDGLIHYLAVAKADNNGTWPGAAVFRGQNDTAYASIATLSDRTYIGETVGTLGNFTGGTVFDEVNTLSVTGVGDLEGWTRDEILSGAARPLLVGAEIVYYREATLGAQAGAYTLAGLLRGRRGTEWAISGHAANERVVLLSDAGGLRKVTNTAAQLNAPFDFKGVTNGTALDTVTPESFTNTGIARKPFAPVDLRSSRDANNGLVLTWKRRTRLAPRFTGTAGISVPLGETTEAYEVDIMSGSTVKRTLTSTSPTVTYTSAQQQADFGSVQTTVSVRVYQVSAEVGRGYPLASVESGSGGTIIADPYESTVKFTGTFTTGIEIQLLIGPTLLGSHTVVGGDTNLSGVATAVAAAVNANTTTTGYSAIAVGPVVELDGPDGIDYDLTVNLSGASSLTSNFIQSGASAGPGSSYFAYYFVANFITGATEPIPSGTTFTLIFQRPIGNTVGTVSFTTSGTSTREDVYRGLADQTTVKPGGALYALGYRVQVSVDAFGYVGTILGPLGETGLYVSGDTPSGQFRLGVSLQNPGSAPVPADRYQTVEYTVNGTPVIGEQFSIVLQGVPFSFTATTTSASDVATGLAAAVDASSEYTASATGAEVTVAGVATFQTFTYSSQVLRAITVLNLSQYLGDGRFSRGYSPMLFAADDGKLYAYTDLYLGPNNGSDYRATRFWEAGSTAGPFSLKRTRIGATSDPTSVPLMLPTFGRIAQTPTMALRFDGADTYTWEFARVYFDLTADPARVASNLPSGAKPVSMASDGSRIVLLAADGKAYSTTDGETWTDLGSFSGSFPVTLAFNNCTLSKIGSRWFLITQNFGGFSGESNGNILFYNDGADPIGAWTTAGQPSYTRAPALNVHEELLYDGTRLHLFVNTLADVLVFTSTDNGATWAQETTLMGMNAFMVQLDTRVSPAKVRLHSGNSFREKDAGGTTWGAASSNGLNSPFYGIVVSGTAVVADNLNGPFAIGNYVVKADTAGVFSTTLTGF